MPVSAVVKRCRHDGGPGGCYSGECRPVRRRDVRAEQDAGPTIGTRSQAVWFSGPIGLHRPCTPRPWRSSPGVSTGTTPSRRSPPASPATKAVLTMAPAPVLSIWRISCFMHGKTPLRSTAMTLSKSDPGRQCRDEGGCIRMIQAIAARVLWKRANERANSVPPIAASATNLRPDDEEPCASVKDGLRELDEAGRRRRQHDEPHQLGHALARRHAARQDLEGQQHQQQQAELRHRARNGCEEDAYRRRGEKVQGRARQKQCDGAFDRHRQQALDDEAQRHGGGHENHQAHRRDLAAHDLERGHGHHQQVLHRSVFTLADQRGTGEHDGQHRDAVGDFSRARESSSSARAALYSLSRERSVMSPVATTWSARAAACASTVSRYSRR